MANIKYKKENTGFSFHASDIGGISSNQFNTPYYQGTVKAGQNNLNKVGKSNHINTDINGESYIKSTDIIEETFNLTFRDYPNNSLGTLYRYGQFVVWNMIGVNPPIAYGNNSTGGYVVCNTIPKKYCPIGTYFNSTTNLPFSMVFPLAQGAKYGSRFDIYWDDQENIGKITFHTNGGDGQGNPGEYIYNTCGGLAYGDAEVVSI